LNFFKGQLRKRGKKNEVISSYNMLNGHLQLAWRQNLRVADDNQMKMNMKEKNLQVKVTGVGRGQGCSCGQ